MGCWNCVGALLSFDAAGDPKDSKFLLPPRWLRGPEYD
jgi:hypothetical protein